MLLNTLIAHHGMGIHGFLTKTLRIMKITAILLIIACLHVNAEGYSQKVTINVSNLPLEKVFAEIGKQSGYRFFFNERILKEARNVTLSLEDVPLNQALEACFKGQPFSYAIVEKTIVVKHKAEVALPPPPPPVTGLVTGPDGRPLAGVSVTIKGTSKGTVTDNNGRYSILAGESDKVLVFSFVGMKKQEVALGGRNTININLEEETSKQDEVVVIGYGTSKVKDMTGAVARVTAKDLEGAPPHSDMASMLQGRAAGVNVMIANGAPGAVVAMQVRGTTSLTGTNQPLWVVDGIPQYNVGGTDIATVLYDFNITDVESIDILKDASSTAIYGSRAANGVVLVTTKKGSKNMKPQIDVSYNVGVQKQRDQFRMLTTDEFKKVITDASRNYFWTMGSVPGSGGILTILDPTKVTPGMEIDYLSAPFKSTAFFNGTTDWWNELTHDAIESKYDISLRGGTPVTNYYMSVGVTNQDGIVKGSNRKGYTGRFNFDTRVGEHVKVGMQMNGAYSTTNNKDVMVDKIWNFRPDFPMYDEAGKIFDPGINEENPLTTLKSRNLSDRKGVNASGFLEYRPVKQLLLRSSLSINYNQGVTDRYTREGAANVTHTGQAQMTQTESSNKVFENTATYANVFNRKHDLVALVGFVMEKGVYKTFGAGAQNFPDQDILTNLSSGSVPLKPTATHTSTALVSALSRLNYKFSDRYLATFTFRSDGSSRFGPDKRWGFFPSGAVAWIVSNEGFMKGSQHIINYLKLRSSYGRSGSQVLGNNDWKTLYGAAQYNGQAGMAPTQLGNTELQWEQTLSFDLGLDYAMLKDRLRGSFGIYNKLTKDIIYNKGIPSSSAFTTVKQNVATIRNRGVEFDISYDIIKSKDITFTFDFNIAHNTAKCISINGYDSLIEIFSGSAKAMRIKVGEPLSQWIGFKWSGRYYQSMEEYNLLSTMNPATGAKIWYQSGLSSVRPGDIRFEDINKDGVVNDNDRTSLGSAQPKFFGGFSPNFRWKGFSLQTNFVFSYGAKRYWYTNSANWYGVGLFMRNYPSYVLDSWSPENRTSVWPRMSYGQGSSNVFNDFWLSRADYLKLNLVRLNYRLPATWMRGMLSRVDLSLSASNLFTLTNYQGIDPEGNFNLNGGGIAGIGSDYGTYPSIKTYNFSIRCSLK